MESKKFNINLETKSEQTNLNILIDVEDKNKLIALSKIYNQTFTSLIIEMIRQVYANEFPNISKG